MNFLFCRARYSRYCTYVYIVLMFYLGFYVYFVWVDTASKDNNVIFAGPVPMKIGHTYDGNNRFTDPTLNVKLQSFRCDKLLNNDKLEMDSAVSYLRAHKHNFTKRPDADYRMLTSNCHEFKTTRGYFFRAPNTEETTFPIAFNILFYKNVEQLERLLRAIYRPQNQYCIHIDGKTPESIISVVRKLADCFTNVFIASKLEIVIYASYTRLTADINCMKDHVQRGNHWKYLINMAATEFPIMSNLQMVKILKEFNGANDIHEVFKTLDNDRFKKKHFTYIDVRHKTGHMIHTSKVKDPPPHNLVITKGNAYNIFSRKFVEFALESEIARELLAWSADTYTPDEHYWATLNNLYSNAFLQTPGGYKGHPDHKPFFGRYIGWNTTTHMERCKAGHYIHNICVFSIQDVPMLKERHELIANKFDIEFDPIAYKCMEELILNKALNQTGVSDTRIYRKITSLANISD